MISQLPIITDPVEIFSRFANDYREIEPTLPISDEMSFLIGVVIDDLANGRPVVAFKNGNPFARFEIIAGSEVTCSWHLLSFLGLIADQMETQAVTSVDPRRLVELLYNWDAYESFDQNVLRMKSRNGFDRYLVSTKGYRRRADTRMRLDLGSVTECTDFSLVPLIDTITSNRTISLKIDCPGKEAMRYWVRLRKAGDPAEEGDGLNLRPAQLAR